MRTSTSVFSLPHTPSSRATLWGDELANICTSSTIEETAKLEMVGMRCRRPLASYTGSQGFHCEVFSFSRVAPRRHFLHLPVLQVHTLKICPAHTAEKSSRKKGTNGAQTERKKKPAKKRLLSAAALEN